MTSDQQKFNTNPERKRTNPTLSWLFWGIAQCSMGNKSDQVVSGRWKGDGGGVGGYVWLLGYMTGANSGYDL